MIIVVTAVVRLGAVVRGVCRCFLGIGCHDSRQFALLRFNEGHDRLRLGERRLFDLLIQAPGIEVIVFRRWRRFP